MDEFGFIILITCIVSLYIVTLISINTVLLKYIVLILLPVCCIAVIFGSLECSKYINLSNNTKQFDEIILEQSYKEHTCNNFHCQNEETNSTISCQSNLNYTTECTNGFYCASSHQVNCTNHYSVYVSTNNINILSNNGIYNCIPVQQFQSYGVTMNYICDMHYEPLNKLNVIRGKPQSYYVGINTPSLYHW